VPPEVFDECRALLRGTNFFRMPARSQPQLMFENSGSDISVKWNGREHSVLVIHPATPPAGYELQKFVENLPGKELP
jgi:hypothetical protein